MIYVGVVPLVIYLVLVHVLIILPIELSANATSWRAVSLATSIVCCLLIYIQTYVYAKRILISVYKGWAIVYAMATSVLALQYAHATLFFCMALYGESFKGLVPLSSGFNLFYHNMFPLSVGIFFTVGVNVTIPESVITNLWYTWTIWIGVIHITFIAGFGIAYLVEQWIRRRHQEVSKATSASIQLNIDHMHRQLSKDRRNKAKTPGNNIQIISLHQRRNKTK